MTTAAYAASVKVLVWLTEPLPLRGEPWLSKAHHVRLSSNKPQLIEKPPSLVRMGREKTFRTNGSLEPGWCLEEIAEMLSERSEFISAFQEPARRPMSSGRFWLDLRSSLLTLGIAQTSLALLSLNRNLLLLLLFILPHGRRKDEKRRLFEK